MKDSESCIAAIEEIVFEEQILIEDETYDNTY